ncbi:MAG: S9 family peptidase [bacterium]|nr:S9 family peptidase [bacterium]
MSRFVKIVLLCLIPCVPAIVPGVAQERGEDAGVVIEGIPEIPESLAERLRPYQYLRSAYFAGWHPSGEGILISTAFADTEQVHWVRRPGGARHQLTFFDEPVARVLAVPDPALHRFVFLSDAGGSESYQLFEFDLDRSAIRMLTDGKSRNLDPVLSNRGDRIAFNTNRRNGRDFDIYIHAVAGAGESTPVLEQDGIHSPFDWSPDDSQLLVTRFVSAGDYRLCTLDIATRKITELDLSDEPTTYRDAAWAKDGKGIYFISDAESQFLKLRYYDPESGESEILTPDLPWDVEDLMISPNREWLAFIANQDGIDKLHLWKLPGCQPMPVELPGGQVSGLAFGPDSSRLAMTISTPQTPGDVYVLEISSDELVRWTFSEVGGLDTSAFVVPELIHYPTFDRIDGQPRKIPAFYFKPAGEGPFPVVVMIHGGPTRQIRQSFNGDFLSIVDLGVALLAPNVRGSSGYGKSYLELDNGFLREDAVKDIGALLDWIENRPELDAERVVVAGGSYGGYMALAAMTHFNDRLRGGIDFAGFSNFLTILENTPEFARDWHRGEYGDERDPEMRRFLHAISPTTNAHKITKPLLVMQGRNDPRVPASEAEQIVEAVRKNGGELWYLLAADEGHHFAKRQAAEISHHAMALFLERFLLAKPAAEPETGARP